ncbi:MAG: hypothetical protein M4579_006895 [Chaenotheca gracillima]|nr:MAG: hypothetical protein M4579_006895 [Chaenotheca gracillima]
MLGLPRRAAALHPLGGFDLLISRCGRSSSLTFQATAGHRFSNSTGTGGLPLTIGGYLHLRTQVLSRSWTPTRTIQDAVIRHNGIQGQLDVGKQSVSLNQIRYYARPGSARPKPVYSQPQQSTEEEESIAEKFDALIRREKNIWGVILVAFVGICLSVWGLTSTERAILEHRKGQPGPDTLPWSSETLDWMKLKYDELAKSLGGAGFVARIFSYKACYWSAGSFWLNMSSMIGYQFMHSSIIHLAMNTYAFFFLSRLAIGLVKPGTTVLLFLSGGFLAANINCGYERVFNRFVGKSRNECSDELLRAKRDSQNASSWWAKKGGQRVQREFRDYFVPGVGASSSVICLLTIFSFIVPKTGINAFFIPTTLRRTTLAFFAFDFLLGTTRMSTLPLGHLGHVGGYAAGALMWFLLLRRGRLGRHVRRNNNLQNYMPIIRSGKS